MTTNYNLLSHRYLIEVASKHVKKQRKFNKSMFIIQLIFNAIVDISTMQSAAPKIFENAGVHLYQSALLSIFICRSLFGGYLFWLNDENPEMLIVENTTDRIQNIFVLQAGEVRSESAETIILLFILHIVYHDYRASGQLGIPF